MREFVDKQAIIDDLKRQCREVFRIDAVKPEDYYIKKDAKFMEDTWTIWCESFYRYLGARIAFTEQEIVKPYLHKLAVQILEKYSGLDICEHLDEYDWDENDISYYKQVGNIGDIMDIIDNILSEQEKTE